MNELFHLKNITNWGGGGGKSVNHILSDIIHFWTVPVMSYPPNTPIFLCKKKYSGKKCLP